MYIIVNKTKGTTVNHSGNFPDLDRYLEQGDLIIVISTYSNTIKVPMQTTSEWEWIDYELPIQSLK
jgi:hypothetical protein